MQAEVDMSGRVEETNRPTAIALSNEIKTSIWINAAEKRMILAWIKRNRPDWSATLRHVYLFSTLLYLLAESQIQKLEQITIDNEYPGYEAVIKNRIITFLQHKKGVDIHPDQIVFGLVGKKSPAHKLAYRIYRKLEKPTRIIEEKDLKIFFAQRK